MIDELNRLRDRNKWHMIWSAENGYFRMHKETRKPFRWDGAGWVPLGLLRERRKAA